MQIGVQNRFRSRIERLNREGYTSSKLIMFVLLTYLVSFAVGLFSMQLFGITYAEETGLALLGHFEFVFSNQGSWQAAFDAALRLSAFDIKMLFLAFISGFTMFSKLSCMLIGAYRGFSFGLATAYFSLAAATLRVEIAHFGISFFSFLFVNILASAVLLILSVKAILFSFEYRRHMGRRKVLFKYLYAAMISLGTTVILNFVRCIICGLYNL